jgi:hypothetical protein
VLAVADAAVVAKRELESKFGACCARKASTKRSCNRGRSLPRDSYIRWVEVKYSLSPLRNSSYIR